MRTAQAGVPDRLGLLSIEFAQQMKFTVLGSGSTGNAVLIAAGETRVLVDAGMSAKETIRRLMLMGCDPASLDGVIITHEHGDHAGGLRVLLKTLSCPVYISGQTREAYISETRNHASDEPRKRADVLRDRTVEIESSRDFRVGAIDFHPFTIPHDAADNFGFTATHDGVCIATLMDFGHITTLITERLRGCAAIIIESNHSRDMLKACDVYPWELKQRILSRTGHLSNEDIADWLREGFDGTARHIVLAHLSQRANNPYVAKLNAEIALQERAPLFRAETEITLSFPKEPTSWIEL
jgi:phosphoribosyl 1,2-cyclic phosphodiesterase